MNKNLLLMTAIFTMLLIPFSISYILITYVKTLEREKCNCSEDLRRKYLKYYGYIMLCLTIIGFFVLFFAITNPKLLILNSVIHVLSIINSFLGSYVIYKYSDILESNECNCSESWKKIFIKYYAYFMLTVLYLAFICLVLIFIYHITTGDEKIILELKKILYT